MEATLKRVYVGGISPSVTKAELTDRFGKFGKVDDVDVISRKDEQGNPIKTFAYLNINISQADLRKCISILNRTKWKGGVLQIEMAKESFLHKLEQERQQAKEKEKAKEQRKLQHDLVQSLTKAGVTDYKIKAAIPGTKVPNRKNWVVSKFGRVLPVLHLNGSKQSKIMKYDPSKFCHNIKKLDADFEPVPVSQLTWELEGEDDEVSRKRRGEFPDFNIPPKKMSLSLNNSDTDNTKMSIRTTSSSVQNSAAISKNNSTRKPLQTNNQRHLENKSINSMFDAEYDSEEELQAILQREISGASADYAEDSNVEVVDDSFELSYATHWAVASERNPTCSTYDTEYDSADTDEIITVAKTAQHNCDNSKKIKDKTIRKDKSPLLKLQNNKPESTDLRDTKDRRKNKDMKLSDLKSLSASNASGTDSSDPYSEEEYEAVMQNCYRLDLTMGGLEALAKEMNECDSADTDEESMHGSQSHSHDNSCIGQNDTIKKFVGKDSGFKVSAPNTKQINTSVSGVLKKKRKTKDGIQSGNEQSDSSDSDLDEENNSQSVSISLVNDHEQEEMAKDKKAIANRKEKPCAEQSIHVRNKGIKPEDIIASILKDVDSEGEQQKLKKKTNSRVKLPEFKGLGSLLASTSSAGLQISSSAKSCVQLAVVTSVSNEPNPEGCTSEGRKNNKTFNDPKNRLTISKPQKESGSSDTSSNEMSSGESSNDSSVSASSAKPGISQNATAKEQAALKIKQQQDNKKRLAAMEERRKERELQKQTIQGALLKLDAHTAKKTHIVFNSESELESEKEEDASSSESEVIDTDITTKASTAKLFDSDDEDFDNEDGKDNERFEIKDQYEGQSGEKLMQLQSRFGVDERFKMDSRFLESSSEEEDTLDVQKSKEDDLSAEKKKNLGILQNILSISVETPPASKQTVKARKFKDLNALQYDPTKEDHTAFETETTEENKESKSQRKKKRLEAKNLPEVSKDTYHIINTDFKEVFGGTKPETTEISETPWDQEPEKMEAGGFSFQTQKEEESGEFTFSFFGTSVEESNSNNEPYKTENIKPAKVAWQEEPRFQNSSSEGEDEDADATGDTKSKTSTQPEKSSIRFFFFIKDDERLKSGPKMFFQSSKAEQGAWEQRQDILLEECRKRHKAAKRKIKAKH